MNLPGIIGVKCVCRCEHFDTVFNIYLLIEANRFRNCPIAWSSLRKAYEQCSLWQLDRAATWMEVSCNKARSSTVQSWRNKSLLD